LPDSALLAQLRRLPRDSIGREAICEILVSRYTGLVRSCVRPYLQSPEPTEDLLQVGYVGLLKATHSLDAPLSGGDDPALLVDILGEDDPAVAHAIDIEAVRVHLDELPEREQRVLIWRFYGNLTQSQIGDRLGISQMHVSRLLDRALTYLRAQITGPA
jgi:RNA polymerase sigma-B factor